MPLRGLSAPAAMFIAALSHSAAGAEPAPLVVKSDALPLRVHVFEDFETEIERRWWLRGNPAGEELANSLSKSLPNRRTLAAAKSKDFDDLMGGADKEYRAVVFNPVPGPPMGDRTRLFFRYRLKRTTSITVQIYSLTNGYHRRAVLRDLPQGEWQTMTVDMTQLRRPDGSGGALSKDERIDDIQFYIDPSGELAIDDIILYEAAEDDERRPWPRRIIFTGWFDTGEQGKEWPGEFKIVPHEPPRTWDAAASLEADGGAEHFIRVAMRGKRPLSGTMKLRFLYRVSGAGGLEVVMQDGEDGDRWKGMVAVGKEAQWHEAELDFAAKPNQQADEIVFRCLSPFQIDDILLFEPREHEPEDR
jgi:hypothetical protein